jgi:hypothetical protein
MESVINKIRQARENETQRQTELKTTETFIEGCRVKMSFSDSGSNNIISTIKSMLISAHFDAVFSSAFGGDHV